MGYFGHAGVRAACLCGALCLASGAFAPAALGQTPTPTDPQSVVSAKIPTAVRAAPGAMAAISSISAGVWSPDGRRLAYVSNASGMFNIWTLDLQTKATKQVAPSPQYQRAPQWSPDGKRLLFVADTDGDEMFDIFMVDLEIDVVRNLTQTGQQTEEHASWSPNGKEIVFATRAKGEPSHRIAIMEVKNGLVRVVAEATSKDRTNVSPFWPQRDDWIYFNDFAWSFADASVMRVRPDGSELENLTPHTGDAVYKLAGVSAKGDQVLVSADASNGWRNVALIETRTSNLKWITDERANFTASGFSREGLIAFTRDSPTETHVFVHDPREGGTTRQLSRFTGMHEPTGRPELFTRPQSSPFSPDGTRLLYVKQTSTAAPELATAKVISGLEETVVANRLPPELSKAVVPATPVWFKSTDGRYVIPALLWLPPNLERNGSNPAVVQIHGEPVAQTRPYLLTHIQALAAQGYIVISPNYRGSAGYDRDFFVANRLDRGGGEVQDVIAAADWLAATGYVHPKKIAAYGSSTGAYLALMAVASKPDRWAAAVALAPFVDFATGYANEAPHLQAVDRALMGEPDRNTALWRDRSPLSVADRIAAVPVMMTAGGNDPRSSSEQARQMERALRGKNGIIEITTYDRQGRGPVETTAYAEENGRVVRFLDRYVRDRAVKATPLGK